jgi:hypothetical protein
LEEEEDNLIREFVDRPRSPTTDKILESHPTDFWPDIAVERAERFRGDFVYPPKLEWLNAMEEGAISCKTTIEDQRVRTDLNPKPDDPPEKVNTFCFLFFLIFRYQDDFVEW